MNTIVSFLGSVRWQDIFDIAVNSYIIFRLYIIFRGTNAFRVLIGIVLLWFFQRLAVSLGLVVTSWAIQAITAVVAIIIIVVFRNEIRSVLQAKNLKTLLWGFPHTHKLTPLEIIVEGVFELARRHVGGLIILPAKDDLTELLQNGIVWDGIVTREMIVSIFWGDNPVHDGAIMIQEDRISKVGVILPLSHQKDLPSDYGTRHRAALGLTEASDALVIIISEEKGKVLVSKDTRIKTVRSREELRHILQNHTGMVSKPREFYKSEKFEITLAALVSIIFVSSVWFSFIKGMETLITLETPIEYMNRDAKVEILDTSVNSVNLNLSGSGPLIKSIRPDQVKVRIDLRSALIGNNTFTITKENISLPPGIQLKSISPSGVNVLLDFPTGKELPIQADWVGKLPDHLILKKVTLSPARVKLVGRNQVLEKIFTVYTEKIPLDTIKKSGTVTVDLALGAASLEIDSGSKNKVQVQFEVAERTRSE